MRAHGRSGGDMTNARLRTSEQTPNLCDCVLWSLVRTTLGVEVWGRAGEPLMRTQVYCISLRRTWESCLALKSLAIRCWNTVN